MSYRKIAKCGIFSSIIFFGLFIFYNFGNALQIFDQYISPSGQPVIVTDWDPSFMPPYYGPTPGGVIDVNQYGQITGGYSPEWDMTRGAAPGDFITFYPGSGWRFYPNWGMRLLLGAGGMYGYGGLYDGGYWPYLKQNNPYNYVGWGNYYYPDDSAYLPNFPPIL